MDRKQFFDDNGYLTTEGVFTEEENGRPPTTGGCLGGPTYPLSRE